MRLRPMRRPSALEDITWRQTGTHKYAKRWSPVADTLLHYSRTEEYIWNPLHIPHY